LVRLYFAGPSRVVLAGVLADAGADSVLYSVVDVRTKKGRLNNGMKDVLQKYSGRMSFFLDSGAFSVYNKVTDMDLNDYCDFVRLYGKKFDIVAALDVIGNGDESFKNYRYMIANGADHDNFILTWHRGESFDFIPKYVSMSDYIGIGGMVGAFDIRLKIFLMRKAIAMIHELDRKTRIHLFGVSDPFLLRLFGGDVDSSDSTTWNRGEKFGQLSALRGNMCFDYQGGRIKNHYLKSTYHNIYQQLQMLRELNESFRAARAADVPPEVGSLTQRRDHEKRLES